MAKIAFILLCHKNPQAIIDQAQQLTAVGDYIAIHFDASARLADYQQIRRSLADNKNVTFAKKRTFGPKIAFWACFSILGPKVDFGVQNALLAPESIKCAQGTVILILGQETSS